MSIESRIRIVCDDQGEATRRAAELRRYLLDASPDDLSIGIEKESQNTQDMGATLVLALGTPAILAVARGIEEWFRKRRIGSSIELEIGGCRLKIGGEIADEPERLSGLVAALKGKSHGV